MGTAERPPTWKGDMATDSSAPVVVVGAGLAGLACAQRLCRSGVDVSVLEAADAVGGRVRTDVIDGFRCDRGFQLLNPAYPALKRVVDPAQLDLRPFRAGVVVAHDRDRSTLADPTRVPTRWRATLSAPMGPLSEKVRFAGWAARSLLPIRALLARTDRSLAEDLDAHRITGDLRRGVVEPFLAGVLAEQDGATSANFVALLIRSFVLGTPAVPSLGVGRFPEAVAATVPAGTVRLNTRVERVTPRAVYTADEEIAARAVVVATDPSAAARLTDRPPTPMKALTTFWHASAEPPTTEPFLHLDADRRGPVINTAVMTAVAPSYAPAGRSLVATTTLGADGSPAAEQAARRQAALVYGVDARDWELVTTHVIPEALPVQAPPLVVRRPIATPEGIYVAGDHRDTASIQGALVSGRRAATAVLERLSISPVD
jgi:phytoene dehydrogenase-like protein